MFAELLTSIRRALRDWSRGYRPERRYMRGHAV